MRTIFAIIKKEVVDNIRDKRSIMSALLAPVFIPLMILGSLSLSINKHRIDFDKEHTVYVHQLERIPNLAQFLLENDIKTINTDATFHAQNIAEKLKVVIDFDNDFESDFVSGQTATIILYYDENDDESKKLKKLVNNKLRQYAQQISAQRLHIRGINKSLIRPFYVRNENVGEAATRGKEVVNMLPLVLIMSLVMGGFYLAIDSVAGERERHSLEPLLSLSISRSELVIGKLISIFIFVMFSGFLSSLNLYALFFVLPLHEIRDIIYIQIEVFILCFLSLIPLGLLLSSGMMLVASFSHNIKEAQTYLGVSTMLPMLPFFLLTFLKVDISGTLAWVPLLSQFDIVSKLFSDQSVSASYFAMSGLGSLGLAIIFCLLIIRMHNEERMLGS